MATASLNRLVRNLRQSAEAARVNVPPDEELLRRFLAGDMAAFEALVWRHGSLVLSACRKVLRDDGDIEDVFQATFLTLLRGARSIRTPDAVGGWLCGVAHRLAVQVLEASVRRRCHERQAGRVEAVPPPLDLSWREACAALHEELDRLPEAFRLPLVLCYLQGLTRDEAARQLGWSVQSMKGRLERGRQKLRERLIRRGITLSAGLLTALGDSVAASTVPPRLVQLTLQAAAGRVPASVAALLHGVTPTMFPKLSLAAGFLVVVSLLVAGATVRPPLSAALPSDPPRVPSKAAKADPPHTITCSGRVLSPDGKSIAGARVYVPVYSPKGQHRPLRTTCNENGAFRFTFKPSDLGVADPDNFSFQILAAADGFGPGLASLSNSDKATGLTLRLVKDAAIQGRLLDINGKPVAGATLRVEHIRTYADIEAFLQTVRDGDVPPLPSVWWKGPFPEQPRTLTTGPDGRFKLPGVGADRLLRFQIEGPGIQYGPVHVLTRDLKAGVEPKETGRVNKPLIEPVYGATFEHPVAPSRPIRGVVRDKKTGKPVAGVEVSDSYSYTTHRPRTDKDGRYELLGYPKGTAGYSVTFTPAEGQPYFHASLGLADTPGITPLRADVELVSGLVVKGRVSHARTGQPVPGVRISYDPLYPNPAVSALGASFPLHLSSATTAADGTYRIVVLPGPGALGFSAYSPREPFMPAAVTVQDLKDFFKDNLEHGDENALFTQAAGGAQSLLGQLWLHHVVLIRPGANDETMLRDVKLQPALVVKGKVVGPDGKPLAGVVAYGLVPEKVFAADSLAGDAFTVKGVNPRRTRQLVFLHKEKLLGASVVLKGERKEPLTVRLEACGTIAGRLLDEDGQPVVNVVVRADRSGSFVLGPKTRTGKDGRFRFDGLVPGQRYDVWLYRGMFSRPLSTQVLLKPGENKGLGDIAVKQADP